MKFKDNNALLAFKYAQAFFQVNRKNLNEQVYLQVIASEKFFLENKQFTTFFLDKTFSKQDFEVGAKLLVQKLLLPENFVSLIFLLLVERRLAILPKVLQGIARLYCEYVNILPITIYSTYPLQEDEINIVEYFIVRKTGKKVISTFLIDQSLIAGIKVCSDTFVWEYTVRNQLQNITRLK